jgi:thiol-disulfide isomerase/thioredoxin
VPDNTNNTVRLVVGDTFKQECMTEGTDVLLMIKTPWCNYCDQIQPNMEAIATELAASGMDDKTKASLVMASLDINSNEITHPGVSVRQVHMRLHPLIHMITATSAALSPSPTFPSPCLHRLTASPPPLLHYTAGADNLPLPCS